MYWLAAASQRHVEAIEPAFAAQVGDPEFVRHNGTARCTDPGLVRQQRSSERGLDAKRTEEVTVHGGSHDAQRLAQASDGCLVPYIAADGAQALRLRDDVAEVGRRERRIEIVRGAEDADDPVGGRVGQRPEQDRLHDTEHGGRRTNAERYRQKGSRGEPACSACRPQRHPNIRAQLLSDRHPSFSLDETPLRLDALGPNGRQVAEALARACVSLRMVLPGCLELRLAHL